MAGDQTSVQVFVRTRPPSSKEIAEGAQGCVDVHCEHSEVLVRGKKAFAFDGALPMEVSQDEVFEKTARPLLLGLFEGFNATVLAYGQTGSGKTYTMGSATSEAGDDMNKGVIRRVMDQMFEMIETRKETTDFQVRLSFYEIYNEDIRDLLSESDNPPTSLAVRESNKTIEVVGLTEKTVSSSSEMEDWLQQGSMSRKTSGTQMNSVSSRSHAICTIFMEKQPKVSEQITQEDAELQKVTAKFHLVDLAGSERVKKTGAIGEQFKEGININQSLLALGNVISALGDDAKRAANAHVPYRDSKLTRLLQDSLGGNSRTVLIGCISPADTNIEETYNTLQYVHRARNIKNKPVVNRDANAAKILSLQQLIAALKEQVVGLGGVPISGKDLAPVSIQSMGSFSGSSAYPFDAMKEEEMQRQVREIAKLTTMTTTMMTELQEAELKLSQRSNKLHQLQCDRDRMALKLEEAGIPLSPAGKAESESGGVLQRQLQRIQELGEKLEEARRMGFDVDVESSSAAGAEDAEDDGMGMDTEADADAEIEGAVENEEERQRNMRLGEEKERELLAIKSSLEQRQERMQGEMKQLDQQLKDRQLMMEKMTRNKLESEKRAELEALQQQHRQRESLLREQLQKLQDNLRKVMKDSSNGKATSVNEHVKALKERERKLNLQLKKVTQEKTQLERMQRQQARREAEKMKIQAQIDRIKSEKVALTRRMRDDSKKAREQLQRVEHQLSTARRNAQRKDDEMKKLRRDHAAKMQVARRKAESEAQFRKRVTEKEASRRALAREKARREAMAAGNGHGRGRAGLRALQLQQVEERIDVEVRALDLQRRLDAKLQQRAERSTSAIPLPASVSAGDRLNGEIQRLQDQLLELKGMEASSCSLTDLVSTGKNNHKHLALRMAKQLVGEKLGALAVQEELAAATSKAKETTRQVRELEQEKLEMMMDHEDEVDSLMAQIPTYQHLTSTPAPPAATLALASAAATAVERPSVQLIATTASDGGNGGDGGSDSMDMDTGIADVDALASSVPTPAKSAKSIMGNIFAQAHGVGLDHRAEEAASKGFERLKGINQSTAQALPFSDGMKSAFGSSDDFQSGVNFFDKADQQAPPLRRSHSSGSEVVDGTGAANGGAGTRCRHSTYVPAGSGGAGGGSSRRKSLTGRSRIGKGNAENVRSKCNTGSGEGLVGKKRHFAHISDVHMDSTLTPKKESKRIDRGLQAARKARELKEQRARELAEAEQAELNKKLERAQKMARAKKDSNESLRARTHAGRSRY